jgi:hypothetical protein
MMTVSQTTTLCIALLSRERKLFKSEIVISHGTNYKFLPIYQFYFKHTYIFYIYPAPDLIHARPLLCIRYGYSRSLNQSIVSHCNSFPNQQAVPRPHFLFPTWIFYKDFESNDQPSACKTSPHNYIPWGMATWQYP